MRIEYRFSCQTCGEYEVDMETFTKFLSPKLATKVAERIAKNPPRQFVLKFENYCPMCRNQDDQERELIIRS